MPLADCDLYRIPVGPGSVHVERYGYGASAIVLLHGFGTSSFLWRHVAPILARGGSTAYALDLLGYGASDRPIDASFGVDAQAAYVTRAMRELSISASTLVASDVAAVIALAVAQQDPSMVRRLVLVSPTAPDALPGPDVRMMQRESARHLAKLVRGEFGVLPLMRTLLEGGFAEPSSVSDRLLGRYVAPFVGRDGLNHFLSLARALEFNDLEGLDPGRLGQPTMIVAGQRDRWCPPEEAARQVSMLRGAGLASIGNAGRLVAEEAPGALADVILAHVRTQLTAATAVT